MASLFDTNQAVRIAKYFLEDIEDPVNLVPVSLVVLCLAVAGRPRGLAWWAMFNGCIIHCWMDGIVGMFGRGPKWLVIEYGKLDSRYWPTKDSLVMMICAVELLIMGPLCLLWGPEATLAFWLSVTGREKSGGSGTQGSQWRTPHKYFDIRKLLKHQKKIQVIENSVIINSFSFIHHIIYITNFIEPIPIVCIFFKLTNHIKNGMLYCPCEQPLFFSKNIRK
ncbi:uncharacterized protein LOC5508329 isoform X1 [Nematostella vectensis]|uniref:uncharacterized protein LOC5508329 isoform X1 n=1 Tax=Nematostella vectensis TaxID=45351 RepID=UPI0020775313|nr:uncharacterized protein LOC5508329 isoform X1 [Nematostella vectensis]